MERARFFLLLCPHTRYRRRWGFSSRYDGGEGLDLRAHVSILVELANLLNLSVGVDARLDQVKLEIEGVEAKVLLKVRLKHIRAILEKALDTIGEHPEILRILARSLSQVVRESLGESLATLDDVLGGARGGRHGRRGA